MVVSSALRSVAVRKLEETHNGTIGYQNCPNGFVWRKRVSDSVGCLMLSGVRQVRADQQVDESAVRGKPRAFLAAACSCSATEKPRSPEWNHHPDSNPSKAGTGF